MNAIALGFIVAFPSVWMAIAGLALALYVDFMFWLKEWYLRPDRIRICEDGLVLFFRYSKPRPVRWSDVRDVSVHRGNPSTLRGRTESGGTLILAGNQRPPRGFPVTLEVAEEIRKGQSEKVATRSLDGMAQGAEKSSVDRKRRKTVILIAVVFALIETGFLIWFIVDYNPFMIFAQFIAVVTWITAITYGVLSTRKQGS